MNKRKNLTHSGSLQIVAPFNLGLYRVYRYIYYCKYAWNFKKIKIRNKFENDNSDILLIDRESIGEFKVSIKLKKYKIFICLWNGIFDKKKKNVINFENKLKNLGIEYNFFLVGYNNTYIKNKSYYFIQDKIKINKSYKLDCPLKFKFVFYFPNIFFIIKNIFNLKQFLKLLFISKKVFFIGGGILNPYILNKNFSSNVNYKENKIINDFYNSFNKTNKDKMLGQFKKYIFSNKFNKLLYHQKIFIFQRLSRHIFLSKLNKFKNFIHMNREFNLGLLNSTLFSRHYFLDFGSSVGFGLYDRSFILYKNHQYRAIKIDFIKNQNNFIKSFNNLNELIIKIDNFNDNNISSSKIIELIKSKKTNFLT